MKKLLITAGLLLLFVVTVITTVLAVIFFLQAANLRHDLDDLKTQVANQTTSLNSTTTPTPIITVAAGSTTAPTSAPTTCNVASTSGNITVTAPCPNTVIDSPLTVSGKADVFEGMLTVKIFDAGGNELTSQDVTVTGGDPGTSVNFSKTFGWTPPIPPTTGTIKFFSESAADGSEQNVVQFPIKFK